MILTYHYRLLPERNQHRALEAILESQRQLYNAALQERIEAYRKANVTRTYFDQTRALTQWRQDDPEASGVPVNLQRATLKRLDEAYRGFFRRVRSGGKPGTLRVHLHRPMPATAIIRCCTFRRNVKGWFVGFTVELPTPPLREGDRAVGIDLGITTFAALSDGGVIPSLRAARRAARRLRLLQRALSRKCPDSKVRGKARVAVRRCHSTVSRQRADHIHQASARLVREFNVIAIEALEVRALSRGILAKEVHDASWAQVHLTVVV